MVHKDLTLYILFLLLFPSISFAQYEREELPPVSPITEREALFKFPKGSS